MRLILDITKSLEENASNYFEQAKLARKKAERAKKALEESKRALERIEHEFSEGEKEELEKLERRQRKKEWYEKFRWFFTSEDFLVIAGRDATTNEIIIKKHTEKNDLVFHTEMAGSPFAILKLGGKQPGKQSIEETAQFTACYSRVWKLGQTAMEVFYVSPEQVSKEVPSGEYITKGAFMIYGQKRFVHASLRLFLGITKEGRIMSGPEAAVRKHCLKYVEIIQGNEKSSSVAKAVRTKIEGELDEIIRALPQGSRLRE